MNRLDDSGYCRTCRLSDKGAAEDPMKKICDLIGDTRLFKGLEHESFSQYCDKTSIRLAWKGEIVENEGDECRHIGILLQGKLALQKFTSSGEFATMRASSPDRPLLLVASSTLCHDEKLSNCVQPCHAVVNGHLWPAAFSLAAASATSGQLLGSLVVSSPAALNASLLT